MDDEENLSRKIKEFYKAINELERQLIKIKCDDVFLKNIFYKAEYEANNEDIGKDIHYARVQLGLAKALDFWVKSADMTSVDKWIDRVVSVAHEIILLGAQPKTFTEEECWPHHAPLGRKHEDGACFFGTIPLAVPRFSASPPSVLRSNRFSFDGLISSIALSNTIIYRIIGKDGNAKGNWWLADEPKDLKNWRSESAVLEGWNDGKRGVRLTVLKPLMSWQGKAASQERPTEEALLSVKDHLHYLRGGGDQIWLDLSQFKENFDFNLDYKDKPWG